MAAFPPPPPSAPLARMHNYSDIRNNVIYTQPRRPSLQRTTTPFPPPPARKPSVQFATHVENILPAIDEDAYTVSQNSSKGSSRRSSVSSAFTDFEDDMSNASDSDVSEVISIALSHSVRKVLSGPKPKGTRPSDILIPSPTSWPGVAQLRMTMKPANTLAPVAYSNPTLAPAESISRSSTPSLDGGISSDGEPSSPGTPNLAATDGAWDMPVQLPTEALATLSQLSPDCFSPIGDYESEALTPRAFGSEAATPKANSFGIEMQQRRSAMKLNIPVGILPQTDEELSAISIPSPGGFFSSLNALSAKAWGLDAKLKEEPSTTTAESFYGVPWHTHPTELLQEEFLSEGTEHHDSVSAREVACNGVEQTIEREEQSSEALDKKIHGNTNRTSEWLQAQETYMSTLLKTPPEQETSTFASPLNESPISTLNDSPISKTKSVQFADTALQHAAEHTDASQQSIIYQAFQQRNNSSNLQDAFIHREARADALTTQRMCFPDQHIAQLRGHFEVKDSVPCFNRRFASKFDEEKYKLQTDASRRAHQERMALQQLSTSSFNLDAARFLSGGKLFSQDAANMLRQRSVFSRPRILDLGGIATADWAWAVALENRKAKVYTVVRETEDADWKKHNGPSNHRTLAVNNMVSLPFQSDTFDLVAIRSASPTFRKDEYDAALAEAYRVLAPGGLVQFNVLDAEINAPKSSLLATKSVEFAVAARNRGYDPYASGKFVGRLTKAGFVDVKRSWMTLPLDCMASEGTEALTGIVGSIAWERWMLKLQTEMGYTSGELLTGVAEALDEARRAGWGKNGCGWKMLVGYAFKPEI